MENYLESSWLTGNRAAPSFHEAKNTETGGLDLFKSMKVLIVDDNRGLASLIQVRLEREGHKVRTAINGRDGYATYQILIPDLIISDIFMPEENGLDMMKKIRTHNPWVKTIYMSGDLDSFRPALEEEQKRYPVKFVQKPFSTGEISQMISTLVGTVNRGGDF